MTTVTPRIEKRRPEAGRPGRWPVWTPSATHSAVTWLPCATRLVTVIEASEAAVIITFLRPIIACLPKKALYACYPQPPRRHDNHPSALLYSRCPDGRDADCGGAYGELRSRGHLHGR